MIASAKSRWMKQFVPIFGAAAIGVTLSIATWFYVSTFDEKLALQRFDQDASTDTQILRNGLNEYSNKLVAIGTLFSATQHDLTRKEFVAFSSTLFRDQPAILGLSWIPQVTRAERAAHELAASRDGIIDYHIRDVGPNNTLVVAPERDVYLPIYYSTKETPTSKLYGFDLHDGGVRQEMFDTARDQNRIVASRGFLLRSGDGDRHGFVVALPIYLRGRPTDTLEERRNNIEGYVLGAFQIGQMVDTILANLAPPIDFYLFENNAGPNDMPVYARSGRPWSTPAASVSLAALTAVPHWSGDVSTSGKHWTLVAPVPEHLIVGSHDRAWLILAAGLLVTGLVVAFMWESARNTRHLDTLARTDLLTGIANRLVFTERLGAAFAASRRGTAQFAVHIIDLDGFKDVNDSLGHSIGDLLLQAAVLRLRNVIRQTDLLARFGGDEFTILQTGSSDPTAAAALATKIIGSMAAPFEIQGNEITMTASVGIAMYSAEAATPDAMMIQADLALYRAKDDGRNCFRFHSSDLDLQVHSRIALVEELRSGIARGELELYYQPQVEIASGNILGLEALVRWNHPRHGILMPAVFIPVAEKSSIIQQLGSWIFAAACAQLRRWEDEGIAPKTMAVNVSGMQIKRLDELLRDIARNLEEYNIEPHTIELELTETVLMEASEKHRDTFDRLRKTGLRIAIDDFGTGYSSLKYLTVFPVSRLKIAQELVFRVTDDLRNATVVKAAIRLAHELGIAVIAEGVDTEAQAQFLLAAGCENAQGYHYSRPVNAAAAAILLRKGTISPVEDKIVRFKSPTAA
jgi:diguanylate cyclase (GGDEF)-like protein